MFKKVFTSVLIGWLAASYGLSAGPVPALGQVIADTVYVDGLKMASGTTLFDKTVVKTTQYPASVHLNNGQMLQIHRNSSAYLEGQETDQVKVTVHSGTLAYFAPGGEVVTLPPTGTVVLAADPQQTRPVDDSRSGLKIILLERALGGAYVLRVNDVTRLDPKQAILLQSPDGETREIHYLESIGSNNTVTLTANLRNRYEANSEIIQNAQVLRAAVGAGVIVVGAAGGISAGAAPVGVAAGAAAGGGLSGGAIAAIAIGVGAAAAGGAVAASKSGNDRRVSPPPVSPF